jgi:hypothetical protein
VREPHYRHTQFGWVIAAARWMIVALYGILAAALFVLGTLSVEVDADGVRLRFGIGLIRKAIPLAEIVRCDIVRTPTWWGWGMHWTPSGWLYNVSGREAVRLEMTSQRPVMIGSDEAERLKAAIDAHLPPATGETAT